MRPSSSAVLVTLLLSILLIAAGSWGCAPHSPGNTRTKIEVVLAPNFSEWVATYAIRNGIITSDRIDLSITCAQDFNTQMMAGNYVIGEMSTATYAVALQNGQRDYKILAGLATNRGTDEVIGTTLLFTLAGSDILSPQDLIGKRVGVPDLQSSTTSMFLSFLKSKYGITPEQLTLVDKSNTILMMLLKNGEIDATVLGQNVGPQAYYDSDLRLVWNLDAEFAQEYGASCFPTVLVVDSDFYSANSAAVAEAYELLIESNEYAEAHLAELAQAYSTEFSGLSVDFYLNIHRHHSMASFARMDARNQACIMAVFEIQQENGVIADIPEAGEVFLDW